MACLCNKRICRLCKNRKQREYRRKTANSATKTYEKTPKGYLMRSYRNMLNRVNGLVKPHLYKGKEILSKEQFYNWAWGNKDFWRLYRQWVKSGYERKLSPSVNRIDSEKGYTINNMEWLSHSVNSSLGGRNTKQTFLRIYKECRN